MVKKLVLVGQKQGLYVVNEEGTQLSLGQNEKVNSYKFAFFQNLLLAYIDAYLVVGLTMHNIMMKNLTVDQNRLVNELHIAVQEIHYKGVLKYMNSCLFEMLNSAIGRFSELDICISKAFNSHITIGK